MKCGLVSMAITSFEAVNGCWPLRSSPGQGRGGQPVETAFTRGRGVTRPRKPFPTSGGSVRQENVRARHAIRAGHDFAQAQAACKDASTPGAGTPRSKRGPGIIG